MLRELLSVARIVIGYTALCIGCFLMVLIIYGYTALRDDVQFLLLKQDYIGNPVWKAAFYIHVFTAVIALFAGFTQFSREFFRQHRGLHRLMGKVYAYVIMAVNVPTGMVLAVYANGQLPGKIAFILLDVLWFHFTYKAVATARARDFSAHRDFMIRSYALTLSALTLRTWKVILSRAFEMEPSQLYILEAWLGFVPNLIVAELIIRFTAKKKPYLP